MEFTAWDMDTLGTWVVIIGGWVVLLFIAVLRLAKGFDQSSNRLADRLDWVEADLRRLRSEMNSEKETA